ncbi:MAG: phosphotransferase [Candidatus Moraniibacteriota bacterium]
MHKHGQGILIGIKAALLFSLLFLNVAIDMRKINKNTISMKLAILVDVFRNKRVARPSRVAQASLPERIQGYQLVEEILKEKRCRTYNYGLYQDNLGRKAFAKRWVDTTQRLGSYWLANEIYVYKVLRNINRLYPEIVKKFPKVHIPKFICAVENDHELILLIEYIEANPLSESSEEKKIGAYTQILEYIAFISQFIGDKESTRLLHRTVWHSIVLLPIIFVRAVIRHPSNFFFIINAALSYVMRIPFLILNRKAAFSHRDLDNWNVLVRGDDIWIIDFQLAVYSHPLLDAANISLNLWSDSALGKTFLQTDYMKSLLVLRNSREAFLALSAHLAIYNASLVSGKDLKSVQSFFSYQFRKRKVATYYKNLWDVLWKRLREEGYIFAYSSKKKVRIEVPNSAGLDVSESVMAELRLVLPRNSIIHLLGSASMGIAGRRDVDIFIECPRANLRHRSRCISSIFGSPARRKNSFIEWEVHRDNWEIDILLIDPTTEKFKNQMKVDRILRNDKLIRSEYEKLKQSLDGKSFREYERAKYEFFMRVKCLPDRETTP